MKISYELNPPKIINGEHFDYSRLEKNIQVLTQRSHQLAGLVDSIHLTDSVLGVPRLSAVTMAQYLKQAGNNIQTTCSVRVRDRNFTTISQFTCDAILTGIKGLLVIMGDEPVNGPKDSGLRPSKAIMMLKEEKYDDQIMLNLSISNDVNDKSLEKKMQARPHSFVTQSISSIESLGDLVDRVKPSGIKIIACIMIPSPKNQVSSDMIGLDWRTYEKNPIDFIISAGKIAGEVLLTSPNSFDSGLSLLREMKK